MNKRKYYIQMSRAWMRREERGPSPRGPRGRGCREAAGEGFKLNKDFVGPLTRPSATLSLWERAPFPAQSTANARSLPTWRSSPPAPCREALADATPGRRPQREPHAPSPAPGGRWRPVLRAQVLLRPRAAFPACTGAANGTDPLPLRAGELSGYLSIQVSFNQSGPPG